MKRCRVTLRDRPAYIEAGEEKIREARRELDADIRAVITDHGPAEAARRTGLSLSTIKAIKGRP